MARIRTVKPDLWTDPQFVACSPLARLMWIGTWNHADDYGVLKDDPEQLKLQILPGDPCDPHVLIEELVERRFLLRRVAPDGTNVLVVRTFCLHQKIDKRATGRWGQPNEFTDPPNPPRPTVSRRPATDPPESPPIPTDPHHTNGKEGTGKEGIQPHVPDPVARPLALVPDSVSPPATSRSDVHVVFDAWRESTGKSKARLDAKRRRTIEKALKSYPLADVIDAVRGWRHSPHHRGENERQTVYNSLDLLLRDAERIEQFRDLERIGPAVVVSRAEPKGFAGIRAALEAGGPS